MGAPERIVGRLFVPKATAAGDRLDEGNETGQGGSPGSDSEVHDRCTKRKNFQKRSLKEK
jgi:hypothetical protein